MGVQEGRQQELDGNLPVPLPHRIHCRLSYGPHRTDHHQWTPASHAHTHRPATYSSSSAVPYSFFQKHLGDLQLHRQFLHFRFCLFQHRGLATPNSRGLDWLLHHLRRAATAPARSRPPSGPRADANQRLEESFRVPGQFADPRVLWGGLIQIPMPARRQHDTPFWRRMGKTKVTVGVDLKGALPRWRR